MTAAVQPLPRGLTPPSPPAHRFFGHLPELRDILGYYEKIHREHGDVVRLDLAGWTSSLVSHPDLVEEVLVHQHKNFVKHSFFWRHVTKMFGQGLLTSEGAHWVQQRKLIQP